MLRKRFRYGLLAGAGIGYVLGTRAGRERYEQMRRAARRLWDRVDASAGPAPSSFDVTSAASAPPLRSTAIP